MLTRWPLTTSLAFLLALTPIAWGQSRGYPTRTTPNFVVKAQTQELADQFADLAEKYRKSKAIEWLGHEMPNWPVRCDLTVIVSLSGAKGATTFTYPEGGQVTQSMYIEGPLERLQNSVLPHEVTHTVFAYHFRRPGPRWADEGGAVYSEDEQERVRHDRMCRDILNAGRGMRLKTLFALTQYPSDVMVLYAQGYSISRYMVETTDRQTFLNFLNVGMQSGWDEAVRKYYNLRNVDELEQRWLEHLREGHGSGVTGIAKAGGTTSSSAIATRSVRDSSLPARPSLESIPVARGLAPQVDDNVVSTSKSPAKLGMPVPFGSMRDDTATPANQATPAVRTRTSPVIILPPEPLPFR